MQWQDGSCRKLGERHLAELRGMESQSKGTVSRVVGAASWDVALWAPEGQGVLPVSITDHCWYLSKPHESARTQLLLLPVKGPAPRVASIGAYRLDGCCGPGPWA